VCPPPHPTSRASASAWGDHANYVGQTTGVTDVLLLRYLSAFLPNCSESLDSMVQRPAVVEPHIYLAPIRAKLDLSMMLLSEDSDDSAHGADSSILSIGPEPVCWATYHGWEAGAEKVDA
jgi:hypothetical protein